MIFLRYESFRSYLKLYPATSIIIAANIVYFIVVAMTGSTLDGLHLYHYGAFITDPILDPFGLQEPWRYITSMFMHSGLEHLLFNMFALLVFAPPLERLLTSWKYVIFYLLCGIGGNLLVALVKQSSYNIGVGASGAIYGIYGAFLFISLFRKAWLDEGSRKTVYMILIMGCIYSLLVPRVSFWGHVGGALTGFLLYNLFDRAMTRRQRVRH